jgi:16S rRNA (cytosine1402-N4)-methyltransferase
MTMPPAPSHAPVLLPAVRRLAAGRHCAVDGTLGHGGHAEALLDLGLEVLGVDRDPDALAIATARLAGRPGFRTLRGTYDDPDILDAIRAFRPDVALLDLGVSSRQLDEDARGFTFRPGAPLDMRMADEGPTAADLLADADEADLARWFGEYGDEPRARALAREVVRRRERHAFEISDDFVNAIRAVLGRGAGPGDFARLFQALRIAVNDELDGLARALPALRDALVPGGRLLVMTYHSGEDRLVKHAFREWAARCVCPPVQPICTCRGRPLGRVEPRKPIEADADEIAANPRARSAKLRVFETAGA